MHIYILIFVQGGKGDDKILHSRMIYNRKAYVLFSYYQFRRGEIKLYIYMCNQEMKKLKKNNGKIN